MASPLKKARTDSIPVAGPSNLQKMQRPVSYPIVSLHPQQSKWPITVRVIKKTGVITNQSSKKWFSMNLIDEAGDDIQAMAYDNECDKFHQMIKLFQVIHISHLHIKTKNRNYSSSTTSPYELTFNDKTEITFCCEYCNCGTIPYILYKFCSLRDVTEMMDGSYTDCIGVIVSSETVNTSSGKKLRNARLEDLSNTVIRLTVWGEMIDIFDVDSTPVIVAVKGAKVVKSSTVFHLTTVSTTIIQINPNLNESVELKIWWDKIWNNISNPSTGFKGNWITLAEINSQSSKKKVGFVKGIIHRIERKNILYKSCPNFCKMKVVEQEDQAYYCSKCKSHFHNFLWSIRALFTLSDMTGSKSVICFTENAEKLLNCSSDNLAQLRASSPTDFHKLIDDVEFKGFIFILSRFTNEILKVTEVFPINYPKYIQHMLQTLRLENNNRILPVPEIKCSPAKRN